ncbi:hypothetical protein BX285_2544 [Streptomyces sp. 1114.5]|uniref:DUF3052 domain-containing protein n=1 Tax=unclassified Streptomyces TaxID=2593676 RepID=UPI000BC8FE90|nr:MULTISPECIES: DUF3052 domain-containing protein [unclassified Streptomyces]RKT18128.1 hypothetical protein BX285_2544 [Streptomyces sp. 1114.5]SOB84349.1 Protein of unknown function [Streptomyces sp. 1331.2]
MSATADPADKSNPATRLGFEEGQIIQELGYDEDTDQDLREGIEEITGTELVDEDYDDVADAVLLWQRDEDGDLTDSLVDALEYLAEGGLIWLLTPKTGRAGHIEASEIADAARTAGLSQTSSIAIAKDWAATRLATKSTAKQPKQR